MDMSSITTSFVVERTYGKLRKCTKNMVSNFWHEKDSFLYSFPSLNYLTGSVVRINPRELHIKDPYYYDEIYAPSSAGKREKDVNFVASFGLPNAMVATVGHDLHRFRRGLLSSFFSKRSVLELSPILHENNSKLMQRFEKAYEENTVLELNDAFAAFTADLISQYSWGVGLGFLDHENFNNEFRHAVINLIAFIHIFRLFPILLVIQNAIPRWLLRRLRPRMSSILDMQALVVQKSTPTPQKLEPAKNSTTKTMFEALSDPSVPPEERSPRRLEIGRAHV